MNITISLAISWCKKILHGAFLLMALTTNFAYGQGTVISVSGPLSPPNDANEYDGVLGVGLFLDAVEWSSTSAFSDVNISVALQGDAGATGVAYLMTHIGLGTTTAAQVAEASFAFPGTSSMTTVLSSLDLGAGTYYLVIQQTASGSTGDGWWLGTSSPTVTSATAITGNGQYQSVYSIAGYAPATYFVPESPVSYVFTVTSVPEPSVLWLILLAGGVAVSRPHRIFR
jgi:hypothetical protein